MLERDFQAAVIDLGHVFGWRCAHFRTAMNARGKYQTPVGADGKGWPDLVLCHRDRRVVLFRELKTDVGRCSPEQLRWLNELAEAGQDAAVWRPSDWDTDIVPTLTFGRGSS